METDAREIMSLMMRMRALIKREFGVTPPLRETDSAIRYYHWGAKSQQPELLQFAKQLGTLLSMPTAETVATAATSTEPVHQPVFIKQTPVEKPIAQPETQAMSNTIKTESQAFDRFIELLASEKLNQPVKIMHPAIGSLIVDKPNKTYYSNATLQDIVLLEYAAKDRIVIEPIDTSGIRALYNEDSAARLSKLLWQCGLKMSHGELLSHLTSYEWFRFNRWPDFFMPPEQTKVAVFLSKHPHSIDDLVQEMNMSSNDAIAFLNASFLCGSLEGVADAPATPIARQQVNANPERKSVISRIRAKLRNLT